MQRLMGVLIVCGAMVAGGRPAAAEETSRLSLREGDPNYSRLLFAPNARPLKKGDGYFSDYELVFPGMAYGITDNVSVAGGLSMVPGLGIHEQVFYISPKVGFDLGDRASVAVGGIAAGGAPFLGDGYRDPGGVYAGFALGTFGSPRSNVTVGLGVADTYGAGSEAVPLVMLGGTTQVARHIVLVGETWMFPHQGYDVAHQPFGIGVRLFNDRLSADVGLILIGELLDEGFPIPWLSVTYAFGKR